MCCHPNTSPPLYQEHWFSWEILKNIWRNQPGQRRTEWLIGCEMSPAAWWKLKRQKVEYSRSWNEEKLKSKRAEKALKGEQFLCLHICWSSSWKAFFLQFFQLVSALAMMSHTLVHAIHIDSEDVRRQPTISFELKLWWYQNRKRF